MTDEIQRASSLASRESDFRDGIFLLIFCGFGRGFRFAVEGSLPHHWRLESIAAHDVVTLSWVSDFTPLSLWRLLDAEAALAAENTELVNVNGLLNLVAWSRHLDGHLVPHGQLTEGFGTSHSSVLVPLNALRELRHEVIREWNPRRVLDPRGHWIRVRKLDHSAFKEDNEAPLYASEEDVHRGKLRGVYVASKRPWWLEISAPESADGRQMYEHWSMLCTWLRRAAPVLDEAYSDLPRRPVLFHFEFAEIVGATGDLPMSKTEDDLWSLMRISSDSDSSVIQVSVGPGFDDGIAQSENVAERMIAAAFVAGAAEVAGEDGNMAKRSMLVERICPDPDARYMHRFRAQSFRDTVASEQRKPILIDVMDGATARIGLGWKVRSRSAGSEVLGISQCTAYLNGVVTAVLDKLCEDLHRLDRTLFMEATLQNYECASRDRDVWRRTARAAIAIHDDRDGALKSIVDHEGGLNACFSASRILLEAALCECPPSGGRTPGTLDLSRAMSHALMAFHYGGWSDAIYWGAMEPLVRITPLGDVHMKHLFMDNIYEPFARAGAERLVRSASESYIHLYDSESDKPSVGEVIDSQFLQAWVSEFGLSLDATVMFVHQLEKLGFNESKLVLRLQRSDLVPILASEGSVKPEAAQATMDAITLFPRPSWRVPTGGFTNKDWFPWRFRRRLSTLRRPIFQLDLRENPTVILAPGLVRDAFAAMTGWFYHGEIPQGQARSIDMRKWIGSANNVQRTRFNSTVENRMKELGWECEKEVRLTKILGRPLDRDYGDIDVLAWQPSSGRVLAIECKDLQFLKSLGEVAEQLADFRGEVRADGKPDHLRKHLNRLDVLNLNRDSVSKTLNLRSPLRLEGHLVFKNPVPMQFAWEKITSKVRLSLFSELQNL